jgi:nicotinamidase-related amidase
MSVNPAAASGCVGRNEGFCMKQAFGIAVPQTLEDVCDPSKLALLVYDMQAGIVSQLKGAEAVTARVARVLEASRNAGLRVFYTRHMSLPKQLMGAFQYRMAMAWQRVDDPARVEPWFLRDSPGFAIVPELAPQPSEAIFDKLAMSAFEGTPLGFALRDCSINAVAIVGIAMEIGIEPTARHAADLGIIPVVITDACGAGHADAAQRSCEALRFTGDAIMTDTEAFCAALGKIGKA